MHQTFPPPAVAPVAVVGAGFSGTITAPHLLRSLPPGVGVPLCERTPNFGRGRPPVVAA